MAEYEPISELEKEDLLNPETGLQGHDSVLASMIEDEFNYWNDDGGWDRLEDIIDMTDEMWRFAEHQMTHPKANDISDRDYASWNAGMWIPYWDSRNPFSEQVSKIENNK